MNFNPLKSMKAHRVLEKIVSTELLLAWTERDRLCNEIRLSVSQKFLGRKEHEKTTQLQTHNTFHEKGTMTQRVEPRFQRWSQVSWRIIFRT